MGHGKLKDAVVDAGPLIHLAEIDCSHLLRVFAALWVPRAVSLETIQHKRLAPIKFPEDTNMVEYSVPQAEVTKFVSENKLTALHAGEQECLYLCRKEGIITLLTDDLAVRDAAKHLYLTPVGSLGIVVMGYKHREISLTDAERYIADLYDVSSLFVTRDLADLAIEQLRKHSKA